MTSALTKIAILGGTSHIAENLIAAWQQNAELTLFCRNAAKMADFLQTFGFSGRVETDFDRLDSEQFDIVVNCIGAGTPKELAADYNRWFTVLEEFDNRCIRYCRKYPQTLYVMFSSGAVYGRHSDGPVGPASCWNLAPNRIAPSDFYGIAKLYSEAKHRSLVQLRVLDLRIFSFFSRYAALDSGYFMTDAALALVNGTVLKTAPGDMVRDYPAPAELAELILHAASFPVINRAADMASAAPAGKLEILRTLQSRFGLRFEMTGAPAAGPNGHADIYIPDPETTFSAIGWHARRTSMETIEGEIQAILEQQRH